jgi:hypothetical protein
MKSLLSKFSGLLAIAVFFLAGCKDSNTPSQPTEFGTILGDVVSANGNVQISHALVFVDYNGLVYSTFTETDGSFELLAPAGEQDLHIQTGGGGIFRSTYSVTVVPNRSTNVNPGGPMQLFQSGGLAYITGQYDAIERVIIDSLGYSADSLQVADLDNASNLSQYDAIFLNCGSYWTLDSLKYTNLQNFVAGGGSIYASDFAVEYLTGDGNWKQGSTGHTHYGHDYLGQPQSGKTTSSCNSNKAGGFIADTLLCTIRSGPQGMFSANIVANDIQNYLGSNTIDIDYDLWNWETISDYDAGQWEPVITHPQLGALALRSTQVVNGNGNGGGGGNGNFITICHYPPGNPGNPQTITINANAWAAHQAHGDQMGACNANNQAGRIYFTTFHNRHQGNVSNDVMDILQFFVLNL